MLVDRLFRSSSDGKRRRAGSHEDRGCANVRLGRGIRWLLEYEHLPGEDVSERLLDHFLVCRDQQGVVGAVAIEPFGNLVLLRSLVVAADYRGEGVGKRLAQAAEVLAERRGSKAICLLTTTAEKFFAARGYRALARSEAPSQIQGSAQFSRLCPSTAVLMVKP